MLTDPTIEKFQERGLDPEVAAKLGAKFSNGRFLFDYMRGGALQFQKVRTLDKQFYIQPKGQKLQFWGLDEVPVLPSRPAEPLVITEGEFDRIAAVQSAGGYVLSVPNGVAGGRSQGEIIIADDTRFVYLWEDEKLIPEVEQFNKVILLTDGDEPGMILRDELALRIGPTRCWFVTYPPGCKDANEVLRAHGEEGVRALVDGAKPMRPGHLVKPSEIPPKPNVIRYSTGWGDLDKHILIVRPEMMVVTGQPNHGKGQFIRSMCFNMARAHGWKTAFLTPEDSADRVKRDMRRFAWNRNRHPSREEQLANEAWIDNHFRISSPPDDEPITLDMVIGEMESAAIHHDCQAFVLDPWNEVEHDFGKNLREDQYIEKTLRLFLRKTRRYNLLFILAAHPTKLDDDKMKPNLYKISGAAHWKNKCQHGVIIHKPMKTSNLVEVTVEKSKDWEEMGVPGTVTMEFKRDLCDYIFIQDGGIDRDE